LAILEKDKMLCLWRVLSGLCCLLVVGQLMHQRYLNLRLEDSVKNLQLGSNDHHVTKGDKANVFFGGAPFDVCEVGGQMLVVGRGKRDSRKRAHCGTTSLETTNVLA
jgi:hypothetical protein